jgi:protein-S-isoprenylcysteine O-methyltransferase Ste14
MVETKKRPELARLIRKRVAQLLVYIAVQGAVLLFAAGTVDWPLASAYLATTVLQTVAGAVVLARYNPEVVAERSRFTPGAKPWDRVLAGTMALVLPTITLVVAGLQRRFNWQPQLPLGISLLALGAYMAGYAIIIWAMAANKFFSGLVSVQKERGHAVATGGPYGYVRHPGYVGMLLSFGSMPVALGSGWGCIPASLTLVLLIVRTALEDNTLRHELEGYKAYAAQVRYRLLPGVW